MASNSSNHQNRPLECYYNWMNQQQQDLEELLQVFNQQESNNEENLRQMVEKIIKHFQEYHENRIELARKEPLSFFTPTWCTSFENAYLWLGGCRPSLFIRLVYSLSGSGLESQLSDYLGGERMDNIAVLSASQLNLVSELQCKTVRDENNLSNKMASLQENIADIPLIKFANESLCLGRELNTTNGVVQALKEQAEDLVPVLDDADKLRLITLKELISILTPSQAVEFLIASKKLHLCIHAWGLRSDLQDGSNLS